MTLQFRAPTFAELMGWQISPPHDLHGAMHRPSVLYYVGRANPCVCCGKSNWDVGRVVAQCMFCDSAFFIATDKRG